MTLCKTCCLIQRFSTRSRTDVLCCLHFFTGQKREAIMNFRYSWCLFPSISLVLSSNDYSNTTFTKILMNTTLKILCDCYDSALVFYRVVKDLRTQADLAQQDYNYLIATIMRLWYIVVSINIHGPENRELRMNDICHRWENGKWMVPYSVYSHTKEEIAKFIEQLRVSQVSLTLNHKHISECNAPESAFSTLLAILRQGFWSSGSKTFMVTVCDDKYKKKKQMPISHLIDWIPVPFWKWSLVYFSQSSNANSSTRNELKRSGLTLYLHFKFYFLITCHCK